MVLRVLREIRLYTKLNKREFWLNKVIFLGHVISSEGIYVDPNKVYAVLRWERPINVTKIHIFLILAKYYKRFFKGFFVISTLMT